MRIVSSTLVAVGLGLWLGGLLFAGVGCLLSARRARRRWILAWTTSARSLRHATRLAALAVASGVGLGLATPAGLAGIHDGIWVTPWRLLALGAVPTAACWVLLHAGRLEAGGRLRSARRQARLGGELLFAGCVALLVFVWAGLLFRVPLRRALVEDPHLAGVVLLGAMISLVCSGFVAVTGGLAGKPRPSCWFAAVFYAGGFTGLIAAYQMTFA